MRIRVMTRIAAMLAIALFVAVVAAQHVGLVKMGAGSALTALGVAGTVRLLFDRDSWLPFLGECVLPPSVLAPRVPLDASFNVTVTAPKGATHVVYWASESAAGVAPSPADAYGNFGNAGVVQTMSDNSAQLKIRCPGAYKVRGKALPRHVHYRAVFPSGIAGPVQTRSVTCL